MTEHTPGPWKALKGAEFEPERWVVVFDGEPEWLIATIENGAPGDTLDTEEATAHVIAAAPELLTASELALRVAEQWIESELAGTHYYASAKEELEPVRAVIAKARGAS